MLALLAGCGDLPRPFAGNPGATAVRLSQPPPARLAVEAPGGALLTDKAAATLTTAVALALAAREVPAVADPPRKGDWRLVIGATAQDGTVVPGFTVLDPQGATKGSTEAAPVDAAIWSRGDPVDLARIGNQAAGPIATLLTGIEAARRESDPTSLVNRPIRVAVKPVTGAPGDGDAALARQMRLELPKLGLVVQDQPAGADFTVAGQVIATPAAGHQVHVEIRWGVIDASGHDLGRVVQLNEVPAGTLNGFWADIAVVVAQEAAGGVNDVIQNSIGKRK
ncbi:MAG: hypothetical protein BGP12_21135 [Rhodospirillales bacterium 70-18]|nr:MAG: hypothetical protein BGP12_21135 [Rhodospirillales bacterium 70-18]